jgi:hypothetical protein
MTNEWKTGVNRRVVAPPFRSQPSWTINAEALATLRESPAVARTSLDSGQRRARAARSRGPWRAVLSDPRVSARSRVSIVSAPLESGRTLTAFKTLGSAAGESACSIRVSILLFSGSGRSSGSGTAVSSLLSTGSSGANPTLSANSRMRELALWPAFRVRTMRFAHRDLARIPPSLPSIKTASDTTP